MTTTNESTGDEQISVTDTRQEESAAQALVQQAANENVEMNRTQQREKFPHLGGWDPNRGFRHS